MKKNLSFTLLLALFTFVYTHAQVKSSNNTLAISMEKRKAADSGGGVIISNEIQQWNANETAIVICDMWDQHWCKGATERVADMATHMNNVISIAREKGVLIVHAPSDCLDAYKDHPARKTVEKLKTKKFKGLIKDGKLSTEDKAVWPIDDSDNGCDCSPECTHGSPWRKQIETLQIKDNDAISDSGEEIAALFEKRKINNVILMGVHTNICVIGRTFGLRSMIKLGKNVVLMRDMTDIMYDPKQSPYVSHYTGNSLFIEYVEQYVCPTIVSSDFTKEKQFRFKKDDRKVIGFITAENEYRTNEKFPGFAHELLLNKNVQCEYAIGSPLTEGPGIHNIENLQILKDADLMVTCVRRRALEPEKMGLIKEYLNSGKPLLAIRTSSHAFDAKGNVSRSGGGVVASNVPVADQLAQWPEFDKDILGGNYQGHYGHLQEGTDISIVPGMENHPLLKGVAPKGFVSPSWLYINRPLRSENIQVLLSGSIPGEPAQPVLWINNREKGKVIYTSLGHWDDWKIESFKNLMTNAVDILLKK
ncbi:MAG: ThuA domain-containing protein [bacterium]